MDAAGGVAGLLPRCLDRLALRQRHCHAAPVARRRLAEDAHIDVAVRPADRKRLRQPLDREAFGGAVG